jgi:Tetratricopeptide repeat
VEQGRLDEASRFASLSEASAADDDVASQVLWRNARAKVLAATGAGSDAETFAREALAIVQETDDLNGHADTLADLAVVLVASGRLEEASDVLDEATRLYEGKGNLVGAEVARRRRVELRASEGRGDVPGDG